MGNLPYSKKLPFLKPIWLSEHMKTFSFLSESGVYQVKTTSFYLARRALIEHTGKADLAGWLFVGAV